jgi:hypothetical protein
MSNAMPEFFGDPPEIIGGVLVREADRELELNVAPGHDVSPLHRITLRPRGGLSMIVRRRVGGQVACHSSRHGALTWRDFARGAGEVRRVGKGARRSE